MKRYVAAQLYELGDSIGAKRVAAALERRPTAPEEEQWEKLVLAAALDPDELWKFA